MKRFLIWLLVLCTVLTITVSARHDEELQFFLLGDVSRHLMAYSAEAGLYTLTEQYVLDYHYDPAEGLVWYTAMEGDQPVLCSIDPRGGAPMYHDIIEDEETLASRVQPPVFLFGAPNKSVEQMVQAAVEIIVKKEGRYGDINPSDNQHGMSVGIMQWHEGRALGLLQTIVKSLGKQASVDILGEALYQEILTSDNWDERAAQAHELEPLKALLTCPAGKAAQDALAEKDVTYYISYGIKKGLESSLALVYFADLQNQWGSSDAYKQLQKALELYPVDACDVTLEMLHTACKAYSSNYHARRNAVYQECLDLGWEEFTVTLAQPTNVQVLCTGNTAQISWDEVANARYYTCKIYAFRQGFVPLDDLVETEDNFCTVTLEEPGTYYVEITAWAGTVQSASSLWGRADILQPPTVTGVTVSGSTVKISWSNSLYATGYRCRITDAQGNTVCDPVETYDYSCTVTLEANRQYQAWVTALCQNSTSEEGQPYSFRTMGAPAGIQAAEQKGNVTVSWMAAHAAQQYRVELLQAGEVVHSATTQQLTQTFAVVPNGDYVVRVAALAGTEEVYGEDLAFAVTDTDPEGKPEILAQAQVQEDGCAVQVTLFYAGSPCHVLAAGYQDGRMVSVDLAAYDPNGNLFQLQGDVDEVRVLVVDRLTAMLPQCTMMVLPVGAGQP